MHRPIPALDDRAALVEQQGEVERRCVGRRPHLRVGPGQHEASERCRAERLVVEFAGAAQVEVVPEAGHHRGRRASCGQRRVGRRVAVAQEGQVAVRAHDGVEVVLPVEDKVEGQADVVARAVALFGKGRRPVAELARVLPVVAEHRGPVGPVARAHRRQRDERAGRNRRRILAHREAHHTVVPLHADAGRGALPAVGLRDAAQPVVEELHLARPLVEHRLEVEQRRACGLALHPHIVPLHHEHPVGRRAERSGIDPHLCLR